MVEIAHFHLTLPHESVGGIVRRQVHDRIKGTLATQQKEELPMEIERQLELGIEGLLDDDCYLAECNLGDLEDTSGMGDLLATSHLSCTGSK
jgi:hypothetical protein